MKKLLLLCLGFVLFNYSYAQTYNPNFLDGRIMFKIKGAVYPNKNQTKQPDADHFYLLENLADYPQLESIFENCNVTKFERPSYFTGRKELMNIFRVHFSDFTKIDDLVQTLKELDFIEFVNKESIYKTTFIPNDTYHSGTDKWYHTLVGSEAAWNISQGRAGVKVAIIDNAVFAGHLDLTTFKQYDVADNDNNATPPLTYSQDAGWSHGTHCAGLATADINNSRGIASLGGNVELIGVKATPNSAPTGDAVWYAYEGVQWACQNGAHVVSMSYGGPSSDAATQALINAYPEIVFLAAVGNDGNTTVQYPAGFNNVIGVGSVNSNDSRSSFSNYNGATAFVDIASPGGYSNGGLLSTVYTTGANSYARMGGTSMATPFAAGLVGLMLSVNPNLTPAQVLNCLLTTGVNINQNIGPRINALAAMQCVQATTNGDPIANFSGMPTTITEGEAVTFYDNSADGGNAITTWQWTFSGGTPGTHTGQVPPTVTYLAAGTYDVTLQVTNSQNSTTSTRTAYINVGLEPYGEWIKQNTRFTTAARGIDQISIVDANVVWAKAFDGSGGTANVQQFTKTTDGGLNWTPSNINVGNANLGIGMIHALSATTAWVAVYPNGAGQTGGIWKTTNGGTTWTRQTTATFNNANSFTNVVYFWDANEGVCQGDPINGDFEIYRTTNGGTTWTLVTGTNIPNPQANEFGYVHNIEVVGDNVWFGTSKGRLYHSTNKGATWAVYQTPVADFGGAVVSTSSANFSFTSATTGLIVDNNGVVYKTTNAGANWTTVTTAGPVFTTGLCYIEGTSIVFTTGAASGNSGSSYSENDGVNWNLIDNEQHLYVEFENPSIGWSGWFNTNSTQDGMWKWNNLSSPLSPAFSGTPFNVCVADTVSFTDMTTGGTPTTWQWSFPGGNPATSTASNPKVTYAAPGTYHVTLTVGDGFNQSTLTDSSYISVVGPTSMPSAIVGNMTPCPFTVENYTVTNVSGVFYGWDLASGWAGTSSSNTINITFNDTSGTLSVTADNVCGSSSPRTANINIIQNPTANFAYIDNAGNVTFTNTSTSSNAWTWDFGDASASSNTQNPTHTYTGNGNYTVTLISTNACGYSDTTTQTINVVITGTEEILDEFSTIRLFPNPASDVLTIDGLPSSLIGNETLEIIDVLGRKVITSSINNAQQTIRIAELAKGIYTLTIKNKAYKFVKG